MTPQNQLRYEAQVAATGRARCKISGELIPKGSYILKVLGYRTNQTIRPEFLSELTLTLAEVLRDPAKYGIPAEAVAHATIRAMNGKIKIGFYKKLEDGKFRFTTTRVLDLTKGDKQDETKADRDSQGTVRKAAEGTAGTDRSAA